MPRELTFISRCKIVARLPPKQPKECEICKENFIPIASHQKVCSDQCRKNHAIISSNARWANNSKRKVNRGYKK